MQNCNGKIVYIGLDIHKSTYFVTSICDNQVIKRDSVIADPNKLIEYILKYFPGAIIKSAYEAGFSGFHLHRHLITSGIENIVVHAAAIETAVRDRVKTDKRDSLKIATQLSTGRLKGIYVPTPEREAFRSITRLRETFLKARKRIGNQLKGLLFQYGIIPPNDKA